MTEDSLFLIQLVNRLRVLELKFRFNKTFTLKSSLIDVHDFIEIGKKDGFALQTAIHTGCLEEIQIESLCIEESFRGRYQFVPILRKSLFHIFSALPQIRYLNDSHI